MEVSRKQANMQRSNTLMSTANGSTIPTLKQINRRQAYRKQNTLDNNLDSTIALANQSIESKELNNHQLSAGNTKNNNNNNNNQIKIIINELSNLADFTDEFVVDENENDDDDNESLLEHKKQNQFKKNKTTGAKLNNKNNNNQKYVNSQNSVTNTPSSSSTLSESTNKIRSSTSTSSDNFSSNNLILCDPQISKTNTDAGHQHHIHRHRHARHHRFKLRINSNNQVDSDLNESVDDPDSISIPKLTQPNNQTYVPYLNFDCGKESNDFDENNNNNNNNNQIIISNDLNEISVCVDNNSQNGNKLKNSLSKGQHLHRSTPNLANLACADSSDELEKSHSLIIKDSSNANNLLMNNYSSNLELTTNNQLYDELQRSDLVLNNTKIINNSQPSLSQLITNINNNQNKKCVQRYKLLIEGDVHVCKLAHSRNVISKILSSKLLRRWKAHRLVLTDTEIYSTTKTDYMDSTIPYHTIIEVSPISKWEPGQKYCLRIATLECHYLIQTNNVYVRDQWIHSIIWKKHKFKSERVLRNAVRPEVFIKEIKNMIDMSLTTPIEDTEIFQHPLELVSEVLQKHHLPKQTHEEVIVSLSPLLEKNHPSPEICDFFSKHCRDSPRSHIVIEMFTPVVQRILKHNGDFGRYPRMRLFVQDYLMALQSQNDGLHTVQNFVISMHSTSSQCPFPRVLPNFVSVCLAAIHSCFEQRKNYKTKCPPPVKLTEQEQEDQLICHTTMMLTMSKFEDWRVNLAQLLQSVPFPDQALTHDKFIKIFKKVVENFAQDTRCEVHQTLLGIREGKEGWFEIFCPGGMSCDDDGELFAIMLSRLIGCCCKKKRFLLSINKLLSQIMILAVREVPSAIETLCAMLDLDGVENPDNKLQIISTLQSTQLGLKMYAKVCERQMQLKELQQKGGPRKLTLPSRSTDEDLAKLLLSGSFGNLECLSLAFTNVTSACAEYLIKLPSLRYLNLWSTKFGDEGLELISEHLQRLQVLNLCETPVTDKGLACLASMKQLRKLNLNSTNLSALTFEGLKECLPALQECDIRYTDAW